MLQFLNDVFIKMGFDGFILDMIVSAIFSLGLVLSVILIGHLIERLEQYQLRILANGIGSKIAYFVCNRVTFVGTIVHELSHALFVVLTGAILRKVRLFEISADGTLGHVEFSLTGPKWKQCCQLSLVSCAPVFVGILLEYILLRVVFLYNFGFVRELLLWYFIISILDHMSMSHVDIKNYLKGMIIVYPMIFVFVMCFQYFVISH